MSNDKTIEDVVFSTGLKEPFIRKIVRACDELFKPYIKRGDKNSLLFDSNAMVIFDRIKQLKEKTYTIDEIKSAIEKDLESNLDKDSKDNSQTENNLDMVFFLNKLEQYHKEVLTAKDELIKTQSNLGTELKEKEKLIQIQSEQLKLLTDGRNPEEVYKEFREKEFQLIRSQEKLSLIEQEFTKKETEVKNKEGKISSLERENRELERKKQAELEKEREKITRSQELISKYQSDLDLKESTLKNKEEELKKHQEKEAQKQKLLKELEELEGKWFVGAKRKELLKQLKELS
jgi:DNA repair exonuclease SbcCD ATPase subunit